MFNVQLWTYLSFALNEPLVGADFLECHRTAGTEFLCGDAYLGTETELGPIGE